MLRENLASPQNTPSNGIVEPSSAQPRRIMGLARPTSTPPNHANSDWGYYAGGPPHWRFTGVPAPTYFPGFQSSTLYNNWNPRLIIGLSSINDDRRATPERLNYNPHMRIEGVHPPVSHWQPLKSSSYTSLAPRPLRQPVRANFQPIHLEHHRGPKLVPNDPTSLVYQINYYFCDVNLVGDWFLRSHMDDQGWVSIDLIANFPRVKKLTSDIQFILDSLKASHLVEVQGDKIRRRDEWIKWIIPKQEPNA